MLGEGKVSKHGPLKINELVTPLRGEVGVLQQLITKQKQRGIGAQDILTFMAVRNELLRLPAVLEHYRRIGVDRFFIVDNGSSDGTRDFLSAQDDVDLFATEGSYAESKFGMDWLHTLMDRFANGHWILNIDADELFIYPHHENTTLKRLCAFLDRTRSTAMLSILLDMYSDKAIDQTTYRCGGSLLETCPYFDGGPYKILRSQLFPHVELRGGPRARVFWDANTGFFSPTVSKVPLVKWVTGCRYISGQHYMEGPLSLSNLTGALLHFKFLHDFCVRATEESTREEHFASAREYKLYKRKLDEQQGLTLYYSGSIRYRDSGQLIAGKIIRTLPAFEEYVQNC